MDASKPVSDRTEISKAYWACQIAGWSALLLFQVLVVAVARSEHALSAPPLPSRFVRFYVVLALLSGSGLLLSHLFYLVMRRRWLHMPLRQAWLRLFAGIALTAMVQSAVNVFLSLYVLRDTTLHHYVWPAVMLINWLVYAFLFSIWLTIFLAVHEFRRRRAAEVHALRLELVAQEAQLRGLRAQLNPHFLFNSLNGLRELIVEDPKRAQSMVTQLSALLRYALESDHIEQVPFEDEIRVVKDYLALEALRFEERLKVEWAITPESLKVPVPPMLLQPLVENALKHGISRRPEGGQISIKTTVRDSLLQLEVINSGELPQQPSENGIGLKNARSRLQLLYGDQATIILENAPQGNARVVGIIPLQRRESR